MLIEPDTKLIKANDVVAMVIDTLGHENRWHRGTARLIPEDLEHVTLHRSVQRCSHLFPLRKEFIEGSWFKYVPGEDVCTNVRTFLEQANRNVCVVFLAQLLQSNRASKTYVKKSGGNVDAVLRA